jgi:hypothetical protein
LTSEFYLLTGAKRQVSKENLSGRRTGSRRLRRGAGGRPERSPVNSGDLLEPLARQPVADRAAIAVVRLTKSAPEHRLLVQHHNQVDDDKTASCVSSERSQLEERRFFAPLSTLIPP